MSASFLFKTQSSIEFQTLPRRGFSYIFSDVISAMKITERKRYTMDLLLALVLFAGCLLNVSGDVVEKPSIEMENIFNKFDALVKLKGTEREIKAPVICVASVDDLHQIENALRSSDLNDVSIQISSTCDKVDKLKTEILKLENVFKNLTDEPVSSHKYRNLKVKYEKNVLQFKNLLDSTKKIASPDRLNFIQQLETEFHSQKKQISKVLLKLETEQKSSNDANVQVAISQLQQGKMDEAIAAFAKVTDRDIQVERVVASVYGNGDNFKNLYDFVVRLPFLTRVNGYKALHEQLKKNNHMMKHHIWMLATVAITETEDDGAIRAVIDEVKAIVRNNKIDGLIGFLNKRGPDGVDLKRFAPVLVLTMYEETDNSVEKVLAAFKQLTHIRHRLHLINELILLLKSTENMHGREMTMIVFEIIKLRAVQKPEDKPLLKLVEHNLPEELRDLMYNQLCIQNAETEEYLYGSMPSIKEENQRHIYTAKTNSVNETFYWQIYFIDNGTKALIKNHKYNEHLFLPDEEIIDYEVHTLRSWQAGSLEGDSKAEFYLDMIGNGQFVIVNKHFGQVLYSGYNNQPNYYENRPVFSRNYDPKNVGIDSKWIIGICRHDVKYVF